MANYSCDIVFCICMCIPFNMQVHLLCTVDPVCVSLHCAGLVLWSLHGDQTAGLWRGFCSSFTAAHYSMSASVSVAYGDLELKIRQQYHCSPLTQILWAKTQLVYDYTFCLTANTFATQNLARKWTFLRPVPFVFFLPVTAGVIYISPTS